jgi:hypothetical protein
MLPPYLVHDPLGIHWLPSEHNPQLLTRNTLSILGDREPFAAQAAETRKYVVNIAANEAAPGKVGHQLKCSLALRNDLSAFSEFQADEHRTTTFHGDALASLRVPAEIYDRQFFRSPGAPKKPNGKIVILDARI